jgi:hypothetical protein
MSSKTTAERSSTAKARASGVASGTGAPGGGVGSPGAAIAQPPAHGADEAPAVSLGALRQVIQAARNAFTRDLRLERSEGKLRVVLEAEAARPEPGRPRPHGPKDFGPTAPELQAALMYLDLRSHLDRHHNSRTALPHLSMLEHGLKKRGMHVFEELPLKVLQRAATQLDGLAQEPVLEGYVLLQARLGLAILDLEEKAQAGRKRLARSSFLGEHKLQVSEASMSDFLAAAAEGSAPATGFAATTAEAKPD